MAQYTRPVTDTANDAVSCQALAAELQAAGLSSVLAQVSEVGTDIVIETTVDLTAGQITTMETTIAAHQGSAPTQVKWHASSVITDSEQSTTDTDPNWTELGGTVTTPSFFTANVASCKGRIVGQVKSNGTGAKLRFREGDSIPSGGYDVPDTESAWVNMQWFSPDAPTEGTHSYILEGQLPASGATQLDVRYVAVSLLEFS